MTEMADGVNSRLDCPLSSDVTPPAATDRRVASHGAVITRQTTDRVPLAKPRSDNNVGNVTGGGGGEDARGGAKRTTGRDLAMTSHRGSARLECAS